MQIERHNERNTVPKNIVMLLLTFFTDQFILFSSDLFLATLILANSLKEPYCFQPQTSKYWVVSHTSTLKKHIVSLLDLIIITVSVWHLGKVIGL